MSPSATPATQTAAAHMAANGTQARHQSQPSAISATPATQSDGPSPSVGKWCVSKWCVNKLCVNKLCVGKWYVGKLCVSVSKLCVGKFCVSKLCVGKLYVGKLCVCE